MPGAWESQGKTGCDVFVAVPSLSGFASLKWGMSQFHLGRTTSQIRMEIGSWEGLPVDRARNSLVQDAQRAGARWIWFVDSDVFVPPGSLAYMMHWRLPILSGLVYGKQNDGPAIWRLNKDGKTYAPVKAFPRPGLIEVDAIPMGCCLIDMRVFKIMPYPWFVWEILDPLKDRGTGRVSEDFYFSREAAKSNFRIYCYTGIECGHEHTQVKGADGTIIRELLLR